MQTMIKAIKQVHKKDVVLFKIGEFYQTYGKDAYIISFLFGYKTKKMEENYSSCGFPKSSLAKNLAMIEEKKINYVIVDKRNNYEDDTRFDNRNLNTYDEIFEKAHKYVTKKNRIEAIYNQLINEIDNDNIIQKIRMVEDVVYERRKI